jgi:hypothetical protein
MDQTATAALDPAAKAKSLSSTSDSFFFVYHIAFVSGLALVSLGAAQIMVPTLVKLFTGYGGSIAGVAMGVQWALIGTVMALSALFKVRKGVVFSGLVLAVLSVSSIASHFLNDHVTISMLVHTAVTLIAMLVCAAPRSADDKSPIGSIPNQ